MKLLALLALLVLVVAGVVFLGIAGAIIAFLAAGLAIFVHVLPYLLVAWFVYWFWQKYVVKKK